MLDHTEYRRWREEADAAARGARLQGDAALHNWACFQAEQAAQLAVKGLLHGVGSGGFGHDLVALGNQLADALEQEIPESIRAILQRLSRHYIPTRYPDAHPSGGPGAHYGPEDVRHALEDLTEVLDYVDGRWSDLTGGSTAESE